MILNSASDLQAAIEDQGGLVQVGSSFIDPCAVIAVEVDQYGVPTFTLSDGSKVKHDTYGKGSAGDWLAEVIQFHAREGSELPYIGGAYMLFSNMQTDNEISVSEVEFHFDPESSAAVAETHNTILRSVATSSIMAGYGPENTHDGDANNSWVPASSDTAPEIYWELSSSYLLESITSVRVAMNNATATTSWDIFIGNPAGEWHKVGSAQTTGDGWNEFVVSS